MVLVLAEHSQAEYSLWRATSWFLVDGNRENPYVPDCHIKLQSRQSIRQLENGSYGTACPVTL